MLGIGSKFNHDCATRYDVKSGGWSDKEAEGLVMESRVRCYQITTPCSPL